jgi:hypothetical protein
MTQVARIPSIVNGQQLWSCVLRRQYSVHREIPAAFILVGPVLLQAFI